jgi:hypothetical protein
LKIFLIPRSKLSLNGFPVVEKIDTDPLRTSYVNPLSLATQIIKGKIWTVWKVYLQIVEIFVQGLCYLYSGASAGDSFLTSRIIPWEKGVVNK